MKKLNIILSGLLFLIISMAVSCENGITSPPPTGEDEVPQKVLGLRISEAGETYVKLVWNAVSGVDGYNIYRKGIYDAEYVETGSSQVNSFRDDVSSGEYYYKVAAYNEAGEGDWSLLVKGGPIIDLSDIGGPRPSASDLWARAVRLAWAPVEGASEYDVYRSGSETGTFTYRKTIKTAGTVDTGLAPETVYYYKIVPRNSGSEGIPGPAGSAETEAETVVRTKNFFGIHTMTESADNLDEQLDWAHEMVGDGGYIKQMFYNISKTTDSPTSFWINFINGVYERNMIPVIRLSGVFGDGFQYKPATDDGLAPTGPESYSQIAEAYRKIVSKLPLVPGIPLIIEIWNEPNLDNEWSLDADHREADPTEYAYFLKASYDAVKSIGDVRIKVINGACSPGGNYNDRDFVHDMFATVPESRDAFDYWSVHPYPGDTAPWINNHDMGTESQWDIIDSYIPQKMEIEAAGRSGVKFIITETGYVSDLDDPRYMGSAPHISPQMAGDYTALAFSDFWSQWEEILAVCPFHMYDPYLRGWEDRAFISQDKVKQPVYYSVKESRESFAFTYSPDPLYAGLPAVNLYGSDPDNLALGDDVTVFTSSSIDNWGWSQAYINDGIDFGIGWTSDGENLDSEEDSSHFSLLPEWIAYDFGGTSLISSVQLAPRTGDEEACLHFPQSVQIEVTDDVIPPRLPKGSMTDEQYNAYKLEYTAEVDALNWTTVVTSAEADAVFAPYSVTDGTAPRKIDDEWTEVQQDGEIIPDGVITLDFGTPVTAGAVRIHILKKTNHGYGGYHAQLSEIKVY
ncbi:MAG: hypothetical protein JXR86_18195 [Spirochaetales bacterium]|nr:hypothetical protein [Spirochaetales bacterium]